MRLGLDIGTNSIGWWLYQTDANGRVISHIDGSAHVFGDGRHPQSKASLGVARREARQARRRRDRYLLRRSELMETLARSGLMPIDPLERKALEKLDPYSLRAVGLHEQISLQELGRALFHLHQRRGFKSNRKTDSKNNEGGMIKEGAARLDVAMMTSGAKTYGEFLYQRLIKNPDRPIRTRLGKVTNSEGKESDGYNFYPTRALFEQEFSELWEKQAEYYPDVLTDELRDSIWNIIFRQRSITPPEPGKCLFEDESRIHKSHPVFQELRLYQTINALRVIDEDWRKRPLDLKERNLLVRAAETKKTITFGAMRKVIKLRQGQRFSLENGNRKNIDGHPLNAIMRKAYGVSWSSLDLERQCQIVSLINDTEDNDELKATLIKEFKVNEEVADKLVLVNLPNGYGRLGEIASRKILALLKEDVTLYSDAASEIYGSHSDDSTGEVLDSLPYYGEILQRHVIPGSTDKSKHDPVKNAAEYWGRITNPTVHIGLNQLRKLVNQIIDLYGIPTSIVVELSRDLKNSDAKKKEINTGIQRATADAERRSKKLQELGVKDTGDARMRLRLWEESHPDVTKRNCPYCLKPISERQALDGTATQIDHILPYARTLDDTPTNKVLCHDICNQNKGKKTPYEAWSRSELWDAILANSKNLPLNKAKRFSADAMVQFEGDRGFEARQLVDTQYLSRIARTYLSRLYPDPYTAPVQVIPGKMTEMLRRHWGLNDLFSDSNHANTSKEKNRLDNRHHAVDAAVIAATDAGLLQKISRASARNQDQGRNVVAATEPPFENFRAGIKSILEHKTVSHKQDHGSLKPGTTTGQLHNDKPYGLLADGHVVKRKAFDELSPGDMSKIRDPHLRDILWDLTRGLKGKDLSEALETFRETSPHYRGIRRVRLVEKINTIPIKDKTGRIYKAVKGDSNHCIEVWKLPDGSWKPFALTTFEANTYGLGHTRPHPAAKLVMRLYNKDAVALDHPKLGYIQMIIATIASHNITLFPSTEHNVDTRNRTKSDPFKYTNVGTGTFKKYNLRKIGIDILGRVTDPGPYKS